MIVSRIARASVLGVLLLAGSAASAIAGHGTFRGASSRYFRTVLSSFHSGALRYGQGSRIAFGERAAMRSGHSGGGGLQCVAFARADSGIELTGNASTWWDHAAGLYERGSRPEPGSVLNFRANGVMRMGHVAVVSNILNSREVEIDHANWAGPGAVPGLITRDISVVDVSPANDWSAVRVGVGRTGDFGSIYPTFGFIYNRPDRGVMVANAVANSPIPELNPAPRDLRGSARSADSSYEEVAEALDAPVIHAPARRHRRGSRYRQAFHGN